jgi:hypothetical protein
MKLYDKVVIFGEEINISYSDKVPDDHDANCLEDNIWIHPKCKKEELARVFIHEFLHLVCGRVSISQGVSRDAEEMIVDTMAKALTENFHFRFKNK